MLCPICSMPTDSTKCSCCGYDTSRFPWKILLFVAVLLYGLTLAAILFFGPDK